MQNTESISRSHGARIAGVLTFSAGLLFFVDFLVIGSILRNHPHLREYPVVSFGRTCLWVLISIGLASAPFGLLRLSVFGDAGAKRALGLCGSALVCLGAASYIAGMIFVYNNPTQGTRQIFTPLGSVLLTAGMLIIFAGIFLAQVWRRWRRFVVMLVWVYFPLQFPVQALLFFGENRGPNPYLLGLWGLCWALLGVAIWTSPAAVLREPDHEATSNA